MEIRKGIPVSPGIAIGTAELLDAEDVRITRRFIRKDEVQAELERWDTGKAAALAEVDAIKQNVRSAVVKDEVALIFDTHMRIIEDPTLDAEIRDRIRSDRYSAEFAVSRVFRKLIKNIQELEDGFFGQRVADFRDIQRRLMRALTGVAGTGKAAKTRSAIVAHDLTPSETASFARGSVAAFATDLGGATSHTAILAQALGIPAVVGLATITSDVAGGETIIIDGTRGIVIINPDDATKARYEGLAEEYRTREQKLVETAGTLSSETADGVAVTYLANIEFEDEVEAAVKCGAAGLGLYRTEFIYARHIRPTEADHFAALSQAMKALDGRPMTVRTLDLGADKFRDEAGLEKEDNPFLGFRSLRICLKQQDIFRTQLRAIFRASALGEMRIMLPMVGALDELREAKAIIAKVQDELAAERVPVGAKVQVGIMVEVPSCAVLAPLFAKECDFFSIGTNDLVQYTLAVDRNNPSVGHLYHHTHPAVLSLVKGVIDAANVAKIPVSVCGEMAGDPRLALLLLGMGLRHFSTAPTAIPGLKTVLSRITVARAEAAAKQCLASATVPEVDAILNALLNEVVGDAKTLGGKFY